MGKSRPQLYDFLYLIIIIVITIIMGVSFGNKLVVHENFVNIRKVIESGIKKYKSEVIKRKYPSKKYSY